jgi:hypothetical protein
LASSTCVQVRLRPGDAARHLGTSAQLEALYDALLAHHGCRCTLQPGAEYLAERAARQADKDSMRLGPAPADPRA